MQTASDIIETLGRKAIMDAVGVTTQAVTNAKTDGQFHGTWYGPLAKLAKSKKVTLPLSAFNWREASTGADA